MIIDKETINPGQRDAMTLAFFCAYYCQPTKL